jgi:hypothetical protein
MGGLVVGDKHMVKVVIDRVSRDEPETDVILGVTTVLVNENGDLLIWQSLQEFPSIGYASGVWLTYEVVGEKEE